MKHALPTIQLKRVYDDPDPSDGFRVLVDRLWPRGLSREHAKVDAWPKDVAPSTDLRRWFHRDREQWDEFRKRYTAELADNPALKDLQTEVRKHKHVTLVYGSKDAEHNHAIVLRDAITRIK